jgi:FecR-like protein
VTERKWGARLGLPGGCPAPIAAFILALFSALLSHAQSTAVVARAVGVTGQAVLLSRGLAPLALTPGYILTPGDRIDTRGGGRVVIDLSDGSMVVVSPESIVTLKDYRAAASLRELFGITLGMVRVKINHFAGKPNPYRMNSPTASIAVRGTEFTIEVDAEGATQVVVFEGAVEVASLSDPDRRVLIEAGRGVLVQGGQDFHLIGANPVQPGNRDAGDRNGQAEKAKPAQQAAAGHPDGPPPYAPGAPSPLAPQAQAPQAAAGAPPASAASASLPSQTPAPQAVGGPQPHADRDDSPRASASTYDRYLAGLADIAQVPFLFRFNAFPEAHLDSLENPAYATEFPSAEGRVFILPTFRGASTLQEYQSAFGTGGSLPSDYSVSPQVSFFAPAGGFTFGGSASVSSVGNTTLTSTPDYAPPASQQNPQYSPQTGGTQTSGNSSDTFYSGALVAARRFGANSFGLELATLKGTGSISSLTTDNDGPGRLSQEQSQSTSDISQTRITAGFSRDLSRNVKLGLFYRYAFIRADDQDVSHTLNGFPAGLNATRTGGHSSEFGMRLRGLATRRLSYGFAAAWLGISLLDGMNRITTVNSHERDRAKRGSVAVGLGYALTRSTTLSFDLAGGTARTGALRTEDDSGALLQNALDDSRFVSAHAAVQSDITRRLFLTASFLNVWQAHNLNVNVYPDRFGNTVSVEDAFFPMTPNPTQYIPRFSDFGAGWRFTRDLFAQYIYSTDYGATSGTHTLMLRYTFHLRD